MLHIMQKPTTEQQKLKHDDKTNNMMEMIHNGNE